ncbi:MAG TPA: endonuclease/exonuclease/phosphatase family protein [Oligoflexus sp.]|uniref:endonuclease/exonuclease/phosphatase family protein n=1 Tax=Oligoflexus sp. TaxID=1971216 RepID=UPI002D4FF986|nr:endonuclease/exonuclease/phosphatase family protein [Oligoflexus sp.]HYX39411.1 endonuclease/exonuclease/phosphatase family protein [Oligoflexus sp.]
MKLNKHLTALVLMFGSLSCVDDADPREDAPILIDTSDRFLRSNLAGNLITTAMQKELDVDIVFYPSDFLPSNGYAILGKNLTEEEIDQQLLPIYPSGDKDTFRVGTLRGSEIRDFILNRSNKYYRVDVQVAGVEYDIQYEGGLPTIYQVTRPHGLPLEERANYRVAISNEAFFSPFPGYRYGNSFENNFQFEPGDYSAKDTLKKYLQKMKSLPLLNEERATIRMNNKGGVEGVLSIPELQGEAHLSPYRGKTVTTEGVITAVAEIEEGGTELYIQTLNDDSKPLTSNAINVYLPGSRSDLEARVKIQVTGTVYEVMTAQGLTRTAIREVSNLTILDRGVTLPETVKIGPDQLQVPNAVVSSYRGNINQKPTLNLADGLDFWESLEGMLIEIIRPEVVGFRGGKEKYDDSKRYLTLYVRPEGSSPAEQLSGANGLLLNPLVNDYNPEVIRISSSELAPRVSPDYVFNIGDKFSYNLQGILSFQTNTFGDGEFAMFVTGQFSSTSSVKSLAEKPKARFVGDQDHVTIGTFNVENLAGILDERIKRLGQAISTNLRCPDVLNLPEIQDNNGVDFGEGSAADITLSSIIKSINCPGSDYRPLNIDPVPNSDGGEPGGNIRVSMIYNAARVQFEQIGNAGPMDETFVLPGGRLNQNPGRLFPNDPAFTRTRKPLVAEFSFKGQRFYVIGVHLNSKLGDSSPWSIEQPVIFRSDFDRAKLTGRINRFIADLMAQDRDAKVMVLGDFNAYWHEPSMKILAGDFMQNLMTYGDLVPKNQWYTANYDGNASAIDHVMASKALLNFEPELDIVHLNSDYMDKISDHDALVARFRF